MRPIDKNGARPLLDTIRWISAFMVALGHASGMIFTPDNGLPSRIAWYIADMRGSWVILFFVISGYLVGGNFLIKLDDFNFKQYFCARFSRIYIVLLPSLLLVAGLDGLAYLISPQSPVYNSPWPNGVLGDVSLFGKYTLLNVTSTIFSLEGFLGNPMGSAGALWSLGLEWAFYFMFPAIICLSREISNKYSIKNFSTSMLLILISMVFLILFHKYFVTLFWAIWIAGAVANVVAQKNNIFLFFRWVGAALCIVGMMISPLINQRISIPMIGFGFSIFLCYFPISERGISDRFDRILSNFSYSLYVTHLPILTFLVFSLYESNIIPFGGFRVTMQSTLILLLIMAPCISVAIVFGKLFESKTNYLRKFILNTRFFEIKLYGR